MSINWVMLDSTQSFVRLPREKVLFTSPPRTALSLQTPNSYPGKEPLSIKCSDGKATITNQRVIYLPTTQTSAFQSFSAGILELQDTHVSAPFFGPNVWEGVCLANPGGGILPHHPLAQLKLTFKEGGAFDFSSTYERMKETVSQAMDVARESGRPVNGGIDADLEQLPAYEEATGNGNPTPMVVIPSAPQIQRPTPISPNGVRHPRPAPPANNGVIGLESHSKARPASSASEQNPPPDEAPPGYEETQRGSVANTLERSVEKGI